MSVARTYASALFHALSKEPSVLDRAEKELGDLAALLVSRPELRVALSGPTTTPAEKSAVLSALVSKAGVQPMVARFAELLTQKGRLVFAGEIAAAFRAVRVESEGGVLGSVESTDPLSDADMSDLSQAFSKVLGRKVALASKINPELLAGLRVTVMGTTYDGSLQGQLARLKNKLIDSSIKTH